MAYESVPPPEWRILNRFKSDYRLMNERQSISHQSSLSSIYVCIVLDYVGMWIGSLHGIQSVSI